MTHAVSAWLVAALCAGDAPLLQPSIVTPAVSTPQQPSKYFCPMKCEGEKTYDQAGRCPVCRMKLKAVAPSAPGFSLEVVAASPEPGEPERTGRVSLRLKPSTPADEGAVQELAGAQLDIFVVSEDLSWLGHEHGSLTSKGEASFVVPFPRAGRFVVFADLGPDHPKVGPAEHAVPGDAPEGRPFGQDSKAQKIEDGYEVSVLTPSLKAREKSTLSFNVTLNGVPAKVVGRALGENARVLVVSQNKATWITSAALASAGGKGTPQTAGARGAGELTFEVEAPTAGLYAAWVEFEHGGKARRARFVLEAKP